MADTIRGDFPGISCSDCGEVGEVWFQHWGPLVPIATIGWFDLKCFRARKEDYDQNRPVRPLGIMAEKIPDETTGG
jgi:hypothetical protein